MPERLASVVIEAVAVLLLILPAAVAQVPHPFVDDAPTGLVDPPTIESQVPDDGPHLPDDSPVEVNPMVSYLRETATEILDGVDLPGDTRRKAGLGGAGWPIRMNSPVPITPLLLEPTNPKPPAIDSNDTGPSLWLVSEETDDVAAPPASEPDLAATDPPVTLPSPDPASSRGRFQPTAAQSATAVPPSEPWPLIVVGAFSLLVLVWWLHHLGAGLSRIRAARILDNPQRQALYEFICLNPGLGQQDIATAMGKNRSTINHHFRMLERGGYVATMRDGRRTLYFDGKKALPDSHCRAFAVLRNAFSKNIAQHIKTHPGITQRSLAQAFGVSASTIIWHTRRLDHAGILQSRREGRYRRFFAGP